VRPSGSSYGAPALALLQAKGRINEIDRRILAGYILGGLVFGLCVIAAAVVPPNRWLQIILCLFGGVLGWVIGIASTPLDETENQRFTDFVKAISAFVSGFVIAKVGIIADSLAAKLEATGGDVLLFRTLLFGTCLLIGFLFPFINRLYLQEPSGEPGAKTIRKIVKKR
jgi:hypothetical protein